MRHPKLSDTEVDTLLLSLPGWARAGDALVKTYTFADFGQSLDFVNKLGAHAETVDHHPDVNIRYGKATVTLSTHDSQGITLADTEFARAADGFAEARAPKSP